MKVEDSSKGTSLFKRILVAFFAISLAVHVAGCSSSDGADEDASMGEETFAEESSGDFDSDEVADGESDESADEGDVADDGSDDLGSDETADEGDVADSDAGDDSDLNTDLDSDDLADDGGGDGEVASNDDATDDLDDDGDLSLDDDEGLPSDVAGSDATTNQEPAVEAPTPEVADGSDQTAPPTDAPIADAPVTDAPVTDAPVFEDNSAPPSSDVAATTDSGSGDFAEPAPRAYLPLLKMKTAAFDSNGTNLNRLYVGRPGDTVRSVSEKLYGNSGRQSDLKSWNGFLRRGVKVGDKIYYQSPVNPTDGSMMTYYEEVGIAPQYYSSRDGDNIRAISKTLLGHNDSWKEIWETNMEVESKGDIPGGISLRYWPVGAAPAAPAAPVAPVIAQTDPVPPPPADPTPGPATGDHEGFDPLATNQADPTAEPQDPLATPPGEEPYNPLADSTPAASADQAVAGTTEAAPPPPPIEKPPSAPPPPPVPDQHAQAAAADPSADEADQMMQMGLAGMVLVVGGAIFILLKRNRSRKVDLTQTTQVG